MAEILLLAEGDRPDASRCPRCWKRHRAAPKLCTVCHGFVYDCLVVSLQRRAVPEVYYMGVLDPHERLRRAKDDLLHYAPEMAGIAGLLDEVALPERSSTMAPSSIMARWRKTA